MKLLLTKCNDKKHVIKYLRDNGTETWMYSDDFFVIHDLSHFAIEKTLGYSSAFCGMLNNGVAIQDFEDRATRNANGIYNRRHVRRKHGEPFFDGNDTRQL